MRRAVGNELRMLAAESFRDVAIPTNRPVGSQGLLKLLQGNLVPLLGLPLLVDKCRRMIVPVNLAERLVAVDAIFPFVPAVDDVGDQASLRSFLNLRQALLAAVRHFGPARAFA